MTDIRAYLSGDIQKWQKLQDSLAKVTEMAIITVDYKGIPITKHSSCRPFCVYVRNCPDLEQFCHKCDSRGGLEAVRINSPYIYLCHCNIVDLAVPIIIDGKYVGAAMAGQIRLAKSEQDIDLEQILISPVKNVLKDHKLRTLYDNIPVLSIEKIRIAAEMLYNLCTYTVEEALSKNLILETYGRLGSGNDYADILSGYSLDNIENAKRAIGSAITNAYVKTSYEKKILCKNPVIRPAFEYIYNNKNENVTLKQMAKVCHISVSHFSRLFACETGEGFSNFLSRLKVEWSKKLLESSDLAITQISDELGFSDPGYYIKVFKKYEKVTPATYRKYYFERLTSS